MVDEAATAGNASKVGMTGAKNIPCMRQPAAKPTQHAPGSTTSQARAAVSPAPHLVCVARVLLQQCQQECKVGVAFLNVLAQQHIQQELDVGAQSGLTRKQAAAQQCDRPWLAASLWEAAGVRQEGRQPLLQLGLASLAAQAAQVQQAFQVGLGRDAVWAWVGLWFAERTQGGECPPVPSRQPVQV